MEKWSSSKKILIWGSVSVVSMVALGFIIWKRTPFKKRIVDIANGEWALFGYQTVNKDGQTERRGRKENDEGFFQRVGDYWASVGSSRDGNDRGEPWSAAFISYVMGSAGGIFGVPFRKSGAHNKYIREYISNRKNGNLKAAFVGYRINEKAPKVGDLVCYGRESSASYDATSRYKGHCDIVVAKKVGEIEVIGGNVGDSVTKKILATDNRGLLIDRSEDWFAIIKNNA